MMKTLLFYFVMAEIMASMGFLFINVEKTSSENDISVNITGKWMVYSMAFSDCPNSSKEYSFTGVNNNCNQEAGDYICRVAEWEFTDDNDYILTFTDHYPNIDSSFTQTTVMEGKIIPSEGDFDFCNSDLTSCHGIGVSLQGDTLYLSGFLGCTSLFKLIPQEI